MNSRQESYLYRAFELAYFIHPELEVAFEIACSAQNKLEVAASAQFKRLYYTPTGRALPDTGKRNEARRTKVALAEPHLLQRLVYVESEKIEKEQERRDRRGSLPREEMIIRFVKHLVKTTLKRNSFYVNLGVGRLLHSYTTGETMDFYGLVVQDPERVRDDYYYRSRKKRLMKEFLERFGDLIKIAKGARGEQRFDSEIADERAREIIHASLERFLPWDVSFRLPEQFDPYAAQIDGLVFDGSDPDGEHRIEMNRIACVLLPENYRRMAESLSLATPNQALTVPRFFLASDGGGGRVDRRRGQPPHVSEWFQAAKTRLGHEGRRRKHAKIAKVSIRADGELVESLDPLKTDRVRFEIDDMVELIEVYAADNTLLAVCPVSEERLWERGEIQRGAIVAEGGQEVSFELSPERSPDGENDHAIVKVGYRETHPLRAMSLGWRRLIERAKAWLALGESGHSGWRLAGAGFAVAALAALALLPLGPSESSFVFERVEAASSAQVRAGVHAGLSLEDVRNLYVEPLGSDSFGQGLRSALNERLRETGHFAVSPQRDDADAVFKDLSAFDADDGEYGKRLTLSLVNETGNILWRAKKRWRRAPLEEPAAIADEIVTALMRELQKEP